MIKLDLSSIYNKLSTRTHDFTSKLNRSMCPYLLSPNISKINGRVFGDDNYIGINDVVFQTTSIPYFKSKRNTYIDTALNLIKSEEILPFLIFINGRAVKLSDVTIYKLSNRSFIYIKNILLLSNFDIRFLIIPNSIIYKEGITTDELSSYKQLCNDIYLNFNNKGYYNNGVNYGDYYIFLGIIDKNIKIAKGTIANNNIQFDANTYINKENVLLFKQPYSNVYELINQEVIDAGLNVFNLPSDIVIGLAFTSNKVELPLDRTHSIKNGVTYIRSKLFSNSASESEEKLVDKYNPESSTLEEFIKDSIVYDTQILNNIIKENRSVEVLKTNGSNIKKSSTNDYYAFSKKGKSFKRDFLMFHNSDGLRLYNPYENKENEENTLIYSKPLSDSDVEFFVFKNIATVSDIYEGIDITSDGYFYLPESFDINNYEVFSRYYNNREYGVEDVNVAYKLPVIMRRDKEDSTKVLLTKTMPTFNTSWYANNNYTIELVPKNLYVHERIIVNSFTLEKMDPNKVKITLSNKFKYCKNPDRYIVFRDGLKIDSSEYRLVFPSQTTAFSDVSIYFNKEFILNDEENINVIYSPVEFIEEKINIDINESGLIDLNIKNKNISRETCLFFINGRKISDKDIETLGSDKIRVNNAQSTKHMSVISFIDIDDSVINSALENIELDENSMYNIMNSLISEGKVTDLVGNIGSITNIQKDNKEGIFDMKAIIHEIVRNYYMKYGFVNDRPFLFDYDNSYFTTKDNDGNVIPDKDANGNIIIRTMDANDETNLPK